ncbi:MAG: hypothetical protein ACREO0_01200 [Pseudoxanthomonas sp.]
MTNRSPKPWDKNPLSAGAHTKLTPEQTEQAKARAEAAGRRYPNPIDDMYVAAQARKQGKRKTSA